MKLTIIGTTVFLMSALLANAQGAFEISPHFGYRWGGDIETARGESIDFEDGRAYGLAVDFTPTPDPALKLELLWSRQDSSLDLSRTVGSSEVAMTIDEFQFGGVLETEQGKLRAYATGLLGATLFDAEGCDAEARFSLSIGGGAKYFLTRNLALRADLRGYCSIVESDSAFISVGGITTVYFSGSTVWQGEVSAGITLAF